MHELCYNNDDEDDVDNYDDNDDDNASKSKTDISVVIPTRGYGVHELQDNINDTVEEKSQWRSPVQRLWTVPKTT